MRNRSWIPGVAALLCALFQAAPAEAQAPCLECDGGPVTLAGTVKVTKSRPDDGGPPMDCRLLVLDGPTCMRCTFMGKRLIKEVQLEAGTAGDLPSSGRHVVKGRLGAPPPLSSCREVAVEADQVEAPAAAGAAGKNGGGTGGAFPPYTVRSGTMGYGMAEKVLMDASRWTGELRKALAAGGFEPYRVEFYKGGFPVVFVREDPANVDLLSLQRTDPESADRKAKALLKANGGAPFELVTEGGDRFRYSAARGDRGFEVFVDAETGFR